MATADTLWPTTGSTAVYSGSGLQNPENVAIDDGVYATGTPTGIVTTSGTTFGNWGFDALLPSGASIDDVTLSFQYHVAATGVVAGTARVKARISGVDQANHDNNSQPLTDTVVSYSVSADRSWTRADLLDGTYEVVLEARKGSLAAQGFKFDYLETLVSYSTSAHTQTISVTVTATPMVLKGLVKTISQNLTVNHPFSATKSVFVLIDTAVQVTGNVLKGMSKIIDVDVTIDSLMTRVANFSPFPNKLFAQVRKTLGLTAESHTSQLLYPHSNETLPLDPE